MPNAFAKIYVVTHIHRNTELLWPWSPGRTAKNTNCSYNSFLLQNICRFPSVIDSASPERDHKVPKQQPHGDHTASLHVAGYTHTLTHIQKYTHKYKLRRKTHTRTNNHYIRITFLQKYMNIYACIWKYSDWCNFTHTDTCKHMTTLKNSGKPMFLSWNIKDNRSEHFVQCTVCKSVKQNGSMIREPTQPLRAPIRTSSTICPHLSTVRGDWQCSAQPGE